MRFSSTLLWASSLVSIAHGNNDGGDSFQNNLLTPKDLLSMPQPQAAVPSPDGSYGLSMVGQHDFDTAETIKKLYLISVQSQDYTKDGPKLLVESTNVTSISQPLWLSHTTIAYLNTTQGQAELWAIRDLSAKHPSPEHVRAFPTAPSSLKFYPYSHGRDGILAFSAHVWKNAAIEDTPKLDEAYEAYTALDEGWAWDETMVREWDVWRQPTDKVHQLFLSRLDVPGSNSQKRDNDGGDWSNKPQQPSYIAPFNSSGIWLLVNPLETGAFDVHITEGDDAKIDAVINIKDKNLNYAFHTRTNIYHTTVSVSLQDASEPVMLTPGDQGACASVSFSPSGDKVAWLQMQEDGNESDKNNVIVFDLQSWQPEVWTETWDRSPGTIIWGLDGQSIYLITDSQGSMLPYHLSQPGHLPTPLLTNGSTSSFHPLSDSTFLVGLSTMTHPTEDYILTLDEPLQDSSDNGDKVPAISFNQITGWSDQVLSSKTLGQPEKFWFEGAQGEQVMGWIIKPLGFKAGETGKWPMGHWIHGGPQSSWGDSWSSRWNPQVFAQQGYFMVMINFHGSTGYGQDFCDSIHAPRNDWGGKPFRDIVAGTEYILNQYPEIDRERLYAGGASYGGYMINWIAGHNDETRFKALFNHDGVFDLHAMYYATDQTYFSEREGGAKTPWEDRSQYEDYNPANFVGNWNTPMFVVQGGQDFRIPEAQGFGTFTALQRRGIPSRLLYFKNENHWVLKPENSLRWHHEFLDWWKRWDSQDDSAQSQQE